jgi:FkbM family methyltransferase
MLKKNKEEFIAGKYNKWEYIDKMYEDHKLLFEYSDFMGGTNISKIEITDNKVIMTFRESEVRMVVNKNDARLVPLETLNFGSYENEELQMQLKLMKPYDTILDIGANYGWYSLHVAKAFPSAQIYAFEPIPFTYSSLSENIKLNNIENININEFGLSDKEGTFDFYYDEASSGNASLKNVAEKTNITVMKCKVKTLDSFITDKNISVDYIKCDIEGAELFAFKGGLETIKKFTPIIFTEMLRKWSAQFNYHPNEIIALLSSLNYSCFELDKDKLKRISEVTEETISTNFFFLHNEKHTKEIASHS